MSSSFSYFSYSDLEKAAIGASGACGHFVRNHAILRTFIGKYPVLLTKDEGRRVENRELRLDKGEGYGWMIGYQDLMILLCHTNI